VRALRAHLHRLRSGHPDGSQGGLMA
jgi:hypothetical protein